jgi:hypothetical protein
MLGTGFIISNDGKIVTNFHVIKDLEGGSVQLTNGTVFASVSVVAEDKERDLAILQVVGQNLPILDMGDSDNLNVGDPVVVVGNPRGLEGTVTAGILSSIRDTGEGHKIIQTDAAVNPGNSGGPLLNNRGQAVGVVSFTLRSAQGLNFAVPINCVRDLLEKLHKPITLAELRKVHAAASTAQPQSQLTSVLQVLKEKLPLATFEYVIPGSRVNGTLDDTMDNTLRTIPISFDSCTVVFEETDTKTMKFDLQALVWTTRFTVPLGALAFDSGMKQLRKNDNVPGLEGKWYVGLGTGSNVVLMERSVTGVDTVVSQKVNYAWLHFTDESIARRVLDSFKHAADLCRGTQPF